MIAVITADIINSSGTAKKWSAVMQKALMSYGTKNKDWSVYRGDEFQLRIAEKENALMQALHLKSILKKDSVDARMSIGLGSQTKTSATIRENDGSAYQNSGRNLNDLKALKTQTISIKSDFPELDGELNLICQLLEPIFDKWTPSVATAIAAFLPDTTQNQKELAAKLNISQGAYSRALKRGYLENVIAAEKFYRNKISQLKP